MVNFDAFGDVGGGGEENSAHSHTHSLTQCDVLLTFTRWPSCLRSASLTFVFPEGRMCIAVAVVKDNTRTGSGSPKQDFLVSAENEHLAA